MTVGLAERRAVAVALGSVDWLARIKGYRLK